MSETTYNIETSITLDYRRSAWGLERIALDGFSNHLPEDSNGTASIVKVKQGGKYVDLKEADPSRESEEVVFEDNGSGYEAGLLSVLFSTKAADALSVGQFGEGLKLVAAAALRNGLNVEYRSRNWIATPFAKPERIGGRAIDRLCFRVVEDGDNMEGSRTVFTNPSPELMEKIFQLPDNVLALNEGYEELHNERDNIDYSTPLSRGLDPKTGRRLVRRYNSRIIDLGGDAKKIFVKGIKVQDSDYSIFSYDLVLEDITPDRLFVAHDKMLAEIEFLLKNCSSTRVIERVLREANERPESFCLEFQSFMNRENRDDVSKRPIISDPFDKQINTIKNIADYSDYLRDNVPENLWAVTFRRIFGENAVVASYDVNVNKDARLMDYNPVRLNSGVGNYLCSNGVKSADHVMGEKEYRWVDSDELTGAEKAVLGNIDRINETVLGGRLPVDVRVYSGLFNRAGREIETSPGVFIREGGTSYIGVKRSQLADLGGFVGTYVHELGHHVTGKSDYDRGFTDFFVTALARLAVDRIEQEE